MFSGELIDSKIAEFRRRNAEKRRRRKKFRNSDLNLFFMPYKHFTFHSFPTENSLPNWIGAKGNVLFAGEHNKKKAAAKLGFCLRCNV